MTAVWVAIDPGARWTGIVARRQNGQHPELLAWAVLDRQTCSPAAQAALDHWAEEIDHAAADLVDTLNLSDPCHWAIEDFNAPSAMGRLGQVRPRDMIETARVVEIIRRLRPDIVLVPPNGHGKRPLMSYPEGLVTPTERRLAIRHHRMTSPAGQTNRIRHARSAWDCAGAAPMAAKVAEAEARSRRK